MRKNALRNYNQLGEKATAQVHAYQVQNEKLSAICIEHEYVTATGTAWGDGTSNDSITLVRRSLSGKKTVVNGIPVKYLAQLSNKKFGSFAKTDGSNTRAVCIIPLGYISLQNGETLDISYDQKHTGTVRIATIIHDCRLATVSYDYFSESSFNARNAKAVHFVSNESDMISETAQLTVKTFKSNNAILEQYTIDVDDYCVIEEVLSNMPSAVANSIVTIFENESQVGTNDISVSSTESGLFIVESEYVQVSDFIDRQKRMVAITAEHNVRASRQIQEQKVNYNMLRVSLKNDAKRKLR